MNDFKCENIIFVEEMEMKFSTMFKPLVRIPSPPIFQRVDKIYNSRLVGKHKLLFILFKYIHNINVKMYY
jgi:hypothetical protein